MGLLSRSERVTPRETATSFVLGSLRPEDRATDEVRGYYLEFFTHDKEYPLGAAVAIQWTLGDGGVVIEHPAVHVCDLVTAKLADVGGYPEGFDVEVSTLLFNGLKDEHTRRIAEMQGGENG